MAVDHVKLKQLFIEACDLPREAQIAFVRTRCDGDRELHDQLDRLLRNDSFTAAALATDCFGFIPSQDDEPLPASIGRYTPLRRIGEGGMGVVYLATQENPRRDVAVKMIRAGHINPHLLQRFELEAHVLGRLQHPNIAQILEAGMHEGENGSRPYFAMEYIEGMPLMDFVAKQKPGLRKRLHLLTTICDAVHHAHQRGIVHRDLKPANILVTASGQPKILDFGIARATDSDLQLTTIQTDLGKLIGTLPYMSPEQVAGRGHDVDTRADIYSLGVILYELLAERLPHDLANQSIIEAAQVISNEEPTPLAAVNRSYRGDLNTIVLKSLEKDPDRRYQSALHLAADIERYLSDEPIIARPRTRIYQFRKFARRNRGLVAGTVLTGLTLVAGIIMTSSQAVQIANERDAYEAEAVYANAVAEFYFSVLNAADPFEGGAETRLRDALDRAAAKIDADPPDHPRVEYRLRTTIGTAYTGIGLNQHSERHLQIAVAKAHEWFGPLANETAHAMAELGRSFVHQGRYEEAESLFLQAIDIYAINPPDVTARFASLYTSLATLYDHQARYELAEQAARDAMAHYERIDTHHMDNILVRQTLAGILYSQRRPDEAESVIIEANRMAREHFSDSPGVIASGLNILALVYTQTGRNEEALELHREVADIQSQILADDNPNLGISVLNLGMTLRGLDRFDEAEPVMRRAIDIFERGLSPEHPYTLHARAALANLLVTTDRLVEAEPILRDVLDIRTRVLGPDHPETVTSLSNLVTWHRKRSEFNTAIELLEPCVEMHIERFGRNDWRTISMLRSLATNLVDAGRYDEAEPLVREWLEFHEAALGPDDDRTRNARNALIDVLRGLGRDSEADALASNLPMP